MYTPISTALVKICDCIKKAGFFSHSVLTLSRRTVGWGAKNIHNSWYPGIGSEKKSSSSFSNSYADQQQKGVPSSKSKRRDDEDGEMGGKY